MQKENYEIIEEIKSDISQNLKEIFKNYKIFVRNDKIFITGVLVILIDRKIIDRYLIEIEMPDFVNKYYPTVKEIGGKISHNDGGRHVNTNGTSCLFYPDDFSKFYTKGSKLSEFIKNTVFYYFVAQAYYEIEGKWIFEEWKHNDFGAYEYYSEKFKIKDFQIIINFLKFALETNYIKKGNFCICGSEKKFRNCHRDILLEIKNNVPKIMLELSLKRIERFFSEIKIRAENKRIIEKAVYLFSNNKKINLKNLWYDEDGFSMIQTYLTRKFPPKINRFQ